MNLSRRVQWSIRFVRASFGLIHRMLSALGWIPNDSFKEQLVFNDFSGELHNKNIYFIRNKITLACLLSSYRRADKPNWLYAFPHLLFLSHPIRSVEQYSLSRQDELYKDRGTREEGDERYQKRLRDRIQTRLDLSVETDFGGRNATTSRDHFGVHAKGQQDSDRKFLYFRKSTSEFTYQWARSNHY